MVQEVVKRAQQVRWLSLAAGDLHIAEGVEVIEDQEECARSPRHQRREHQWALVLQQQCGRDSVDARSTLKLYAGDEIDVHSSSPRPIPRAAAVAVRPGVVLLRLPMNPHTMITLK